MHIGIFTVGSRGDVQPYVALALGLMEKGYTVTLGAPENFKDFVEGFGVDFHPLHGNVEEVINSAEAQSLLKNESPFRLLKFFRSEGHKIRIKLREDLMAGCLKVDVLVASYLTTYPISVIAEKLGKKWAIVNLNPPLLTTKETPALPFDFLPFSFLNRWSYRISEFVEWQINRRDMQEFRMVLGLTPLKTSLTQEIRKNKISVVNAISPLLLKRPSDWEEQLLVTGFLRMPDQKNSTYRPEKIPSGLEEWLSNGPAPIYIGFGSIPFPEKQLFLKTLNDLLNVPHLRLVFCTGWFQLQDIPLHPDLFVVKSIDHKWLFPRCKAAVIHGGIGTLTTVLQSGIPAIVVSIFADQPYWGKRIARQKLGVHLPWKQLSAKKVELAVMEACLPERLLLLSDVAMRLKAEKGTEWTIQALEKHLY